MDDQQRRNVCFDQPEGRYNPNFMPAFNTTNTLIRNSVSGEVVGSCSQGGSRLSSSALPPPYGSHLPALTYDPALYLPLPRSYVHHAAVNQHHVHQAGLNQINPVLLSSPNDNNNCNRSRAASLSSVLEIQQPAHHPLRPIPSYVPSTYYDSQKSHESNQPVRYTPDLPNHYRRNSTTAVFPGQPEVILPPLGPTALPSDQSKVQAFNAHPFYIRNQVPYLVAGVSHHLPHYPSSLADPYRHNHNINPVFRRDRYSVGAPLTNSGQAVDITMARRRNSIPTSLEVQQVVDEDSDDDDVFDAPEDAPTQNMTDQETYLEQLRESRKRALSSGEPSTSQPKYVCRDMGVGQSLTPRSRFRSRITDDKRLHYEMEVSAGPKPTMQLQDVSTPGASTTMQTIVKDTHTEPASSSQTHKDCVQRAKENAECSNEISHLSKPSEDPAMPSIVNHKNVAARNLTPSPSILKKSKIRLVRNNLLQTGADSTRGSFSAAGQGSSATPRTLPFKKQVAWKDDPSFNSNNVIKTTPNALSDSIITSMKHDLLTEQNLIDIRKNPGAFTVKRRIGPYIFGPRLGSSPVRSIAQYLVRKEHTFKYYMAKVLNLGGESNDDKSGRMLLLSEHSLLTLLKNHPGVIRHHGFHKDVAFDQSTGEFQGRLCLILDCLTQHEYDDRTRDYLNLQQHVIKVKRLAERETIRIFTSIVKVVQSLHEQNVVHRDLKLGNMVLHCKTQRVILTNFCLGRHLMSGKELLKDQRGSPAYISPDVLSGKPYAGKPSDMWSLGVVLFMMLYGQFPFYDIEPSKLFRKIKKLDFVIPSNVHMSSNINDVIRGLLTLDPTQRLTADDTLLALQRCANTWNVIRYLPLEAQVVPDVDNEKESSDDSEDDKNDELEQQKYEEKLTRDFRKKLQSDDDDDDSAESQVKGFGRLGFQSTMPAVRHLPYDARPLTQDEIALHRRLLLSSTLGVRVQSAN